MAQLKIKLFGTPGIYQDGTLVNFPFRKAEAVLYYLAVNGQTSREELAALLWGETDDAGARKCLRDALYKIRRAIGTDDLFRAEKQIAAFAPTVTIETDTAVFLDSGSLEESVEAYSGEFLSGFAVKDAEEFETWARARRQEFRELYIKKLYKRIEESKNDPNTDIEAYARRIIRADEFDENAYRILMESFAQRGAFNKAVELYNLLLELLEEELGITPDTQTRKLYAKVMEMRRSFQPDKDTGQPQTPDRFFFGRGPELQLLKHQYNTFIHPPKPGLKAAKSIFITGEAGIGKTNLKDQFLHSVSPSACTLIETHCYPAEENYLLKPWNGVMAKVLDILRRSGSDVPLMWETVIAEVFPFLAPLSSQWQGAKQKPVEKTGSLKPAVIEETIIHLLKAASRSKKILLVFEDLQWIDNMSLSLVSALLLQEECRDILFVGTMRSGHGENLDRFLALMSRYDKLERIGLKRFSRQETFDFITQAMPGREMKQEMKQRIYTETEGNPFFMVEFLNLLRDKKEMNVSQALNGMTSRMQGILESRIMDISDGGKKLLNIMSLFFDKIDLDLLQRVSGKSEYQLLDMIEELKQKYIIKEFDEDGSIFYDFTHHKLREFVYSRQSLGRRKILHNKIGTVLEQFLENAKRDIVMYPRLIYHFTNGRNLPAALKYSIKNARVYLDVSHDLFPELRPVKTDKNKYIQGTSREAALKYMDQIRELVEKVKDAERETDDIIALEMEFLYIQGRYLIMQGDYHKGVQVINRVIHGAGRIGNHRQAVKAHIQMIFYAYQAHRKDIMSQHIEAAATIARTFDFKRDKGILMRLKGLLLIITGDYSEAEKQLRDSIQWFETLDPGGGAYALHIAAAYNYIGDIRRINRGFTEAIELYGKAIEISREKQALSSLATFNTNAGHAAYEMGDHDTAQRYFLEAVDMYDKFDTLWGRSNAEGYLALILIEQNKFSAALECLERGLFYAEKLKNPYRLGVIYKIMAQIRKEMEANQPLKQVFNHFLGQSPDHYIDRAREFFRQTDSAYEIAGLEKI